LDIFFDPVVPQYKCSLGQSLCTDQLTLIVGTPERRSGRMIPRQLDSNCVMF
jgi:hypothetical protein